MLCTVFIVLFGFEGYRITPGLSASGDPLWLRALLFAVYSGVLFFGGTFLRPKASKLSVLFEGVLLFLEWILGAIGTWLLLNFFWQWQDLEWSTAWEIFWQYGLMVSIPLIWWSFGRRKQAQNSEEAQAYRFRDENDQIKLQLNKEHLLWVQSAGNYCELHYQQEGQKQSYLLRNSLKRVEQAHPDLIRVHRSFLVPERAVQGQKKRKGKWELLLKDGSILPVGPAYAKNSPWPHLRPV